MFSVFFRMEGFMSIRGGTHHIPFVQGLMVVQCSDGHQICVFGVCKNSDMTGWMARDGILGASTCKERLR
jgi:hypothetical protein